MGGDWQQTLPVVPGGSHAHNCAASLQASRIWHDLNHLPLYENMRLRNADRLTADYAKWLSDVAHNQQAVDIPSYIPTTDDVDDLVRHIFPPEDLLSALSDPHFSNRS